MAARTMSATLRLWPRCTTSAPRACNRRRIMLMAASWPSNSEAADTNRRGGRERAASLLGAAAPPLRPAFIACSLPDSRIATHQYGRGPGERSTRTAGPPPPAAAVTLPRPRRYNTPEAMNSRRASPPAAGKQPETAASPWRASRERLRDRALKREAVIRAAAGALNRIAHWYREDQSLTGAQIAAAFVAVFEGGLRPRAGAAPLAVRRGTRRRARRPAQAVAR